MRLTMAAGWSWRRQGLGRSLKRVPRIVIFALLAPAVSLGATRLQACIVCRSTVFTHPSTDPYHVKNLYGFNHAPSVVGLPDGRLLAAWFSGPFEASVHQSVVVEVNRENKCKEED